MCYSEEIYFNCLFVSNSLSLDFFLKRKMSGKVGSEVLVLTWGNYSTVSTSKTSADL